MEENRGSCYGSILLLESSGGSSTLPPLTPFDGVPEDLVAKFKAKLIQVTGSEAEKKWEFLSRCNSCERVQCIESYLKATQG